MLATPAHILRLLAILTILVGAVATHEVAMAEGASAATQGIHTHHLAPGVEPTEGHCSGSFCEQSSPCCLLGYCLVGITIPEDIGFAFVSRPELSGARISLLTGRLAAAPYRPPAAA